jgi:DNA-binding transcriptional MerR regulator
VSCGQSVKHVLRPHTNLAIGELARLAQVSTRSLRYYEEQGLLTPARTSEGHRRYPAGALRCVKLFKALFDAGMTSALVREAVAKWHANSTPDVEAILRVRHAEITEQIARQTVALRNLEGILASVSEGSGEWGVTAVAAKAGWETGDRLRSRLAFTLA